MMRSILQGLIFLFVAQQWVIAAEPAATTTPVDTEPKVYRSVGPNGEIIFSDQPSKGAKEVEISPPGSNTYEPVQVPSFSPYEPERNKPRANAFTYNTLYISAPANEETLWADTGEVTIQLMLEPSLQPGHQIVYVIDGHATSHNSLSLTLQNVDRGEHKVQVEIRDSHGQVVQSTPTITLYVRRPAVKR